jgi:predicted ATPase
MIVSIKDHFGAEIVYRDIFRGTGRSNTELKVIRKETFVSHKNNEVPLEAMGHGFRNLYRLLFTRAAYSWDAYVNQTNYFPICEEPEIGLHPDWQVKLFKLIKSGIIETHSLIILRALQLEVAEGNFSSDDVMIHNFYRDENDDIEVKQIRVLKSGILSDDFESGFQDELVHIEHKLWQIQQKLINRN